MSYYGSLAIQLSHDVYCSIFCAQLSSHNSKSCFDIDHNDHYYHDPYSEMPRSSLVDKARVIGQIQAGYTKKWMVEFMSGVDQENVLLGQHAVQA